MPQMMPIWWSVMLVVTLLFFLCMNTILYFFPLLNLDDSGKCYKEHLNKFIDLSSYDL